MDLNELRQERDKLEQNIMESVNVLVEDFKNKTSETPSSITINMITLGYPGEETYKFNRIVSGVVVALDV